MLKELEYIKLNKKISKLVSNTNIGVFDLETFIPPAHRAGGIDNDGIGKVYTLRFVTIGNKRKLYYLNDYFDSFYLVLICLNYIWRYKSKVLNLLSILYF